MDEGSILTYNYLLYMCTYFIYNIILENDNIIILLIWQN